MANNDIKIEKVTDILPILEVENNLEHAILSMESVKQDISNELYNYSVILYDGNIAGYIAFCNCIDHTDLISVAVKPKYRRLGLARKLMEYMERICTSNQLFPIFLEVRESNLSAIKLYESLGYTLINKRISYYTNPVENAIIYMKTSPTF